MLDEVSTPGDISFPCCAVLRYNSEIIELDGIPKRNTLQFIAATYIVLFQSLAFLLQKGIIADRHSEPQSRLRGPILSHHLGIFWVLLSLVDVQRQKVHSLLLYLY